MTPDSIQRTRLTLVQVLKLIQDLPRILAGQLPDPTGGVARQLLLAVGVEGLTIVQEAYLDKARRGADQAGIKWAGLAPSTLLRRRKAAQAIEGVRKRQRPFTARERQRWGQLFRAELGRGRQRGLSREEAAHSAHGYAWIQLNHELLQGRKPAPVYTPGSKPPGYEILRDTGRLFNSLTPPISGNRVNTETILQAMPGKVVGGTKVYYAGFHHEGTSRMPRRPLWPADNAWPQAWTDRLMQVLAQGLSLLLKKVL